MRSLVHGQVSRCICAVFSAWASIEVFLSDLVRGQVSRSICAV